MAYYSKEIYEKKQTYADKRMVENSKNTSLSEEQHDALAYICSVRHKVHSDPKSAEILFNSESSNHLEYWEFIDTSNCDNPIFMALEKTGLPEWSWVFNSCDEAIDYDWYEVPEFIASNYPQSKTFDDFYTERIFELSNLINKWNNSIEDYLKEIDKKYGTQYCPSGLSRIDNIIALGSEKLSEIKHSATQIKTEDDLEL